MERRIILCDFEDTKEVLASIAIPIKIHKISESPRYDTTTFYLDCKDALGRNLLLSFRYYIYHTKYTYWQIAYSALNCKTTLYQMVWINQIYDQYKNFPVEEAPYAFKVAKYLIDTGRAYIENPTKGMTRGYLADLYKKPPTKTDYIHRLINFIKELIP